jgi:hypothetical protein
MVGQRRRKMNWLSLRDVAIRLLGREERRCLEDIRAHGRVKNRQDSPGEIPFPVPVCPTTPLDNPSAGLQYGGTMSWVEALEPWPS